MKVSVEIGTKYVNFDEPDTEDAIAFKTTEIFKIDSKSDETSKRNVKGHASLSPNNVTLMDNQLSVYSEFFEEEFEFMTVDKVS